MNNRIQSGIYKLTNCINNKLYIGSSKRLYRRKKQHFSSLKEGTHHNLHLQHSYNKYPLNTFSFSIVEYVDNIAELLDVEQKHINSYPTSMLYNHIIDLSSNTPTSLPTNHKFQLVKNLSPLVDLNLNDIIEKYLTKISKKDKCAILTAYTQEEIFIRVWKLTQDINLAIKFTPILSFDESVKILKHHNYIH